MIHFPCPSCYKRLQAHDSKAGADGFCPHCSSCFTITTCDPKARFTTRFRRCHSRHRSFCAALHDDLAGTDFSALCSSVDYLVAHDIPGDVVECGVWKGGSMMAVARALWPAVPCGHFTCSTRLREWLSRLMST